MVHPRLEKGHGDKGEMMLTWLFYSILNIAGSWLLLRNKSFVRAVCGSDISPSMFFVGAVWFVGILPHFQYLITILLACFVAMVIISTIPKLMKNMTLEEFEKSVFKEK